MIKKVCPKMIVVISPVEFQTLDNGVLLLAQVNAAGLEGKCVSASVVLWEECRGMLVTWLSNCSFDLWTLKVSDHLKSVVFDCSPLQPRNTTPCAGPGKVGRGGTAHSLTYFPHVQLTWMHNKFWLSGIDKMWYYLQ